MSVINQVESKRWLWFERGLYLLILFMVLIAAGLMVWTNLERLQQIRSSDEDIHTVNWTISLAATPESAGQAPPATGEGTPAAPPVIDLSDNQEAALLFEAANQALEKAEEANADAQDSVDSAQLVLSFLEGVGFLLALASGAAAIFGLRSVGGVLKDINDAAQDNAREYEESYRTLKELAKNSSDLITPHESLLRNLPLIVQDLKAEWQQALDDSQNISMDLLQANQELQLNNYREAYEAINRVLKVAPDNPMALYFAGWLELQYISGQIDEGVKKLQRVRDIAPHWAAAIAAHGVVLRRLATRPENANRREDLMNQAEGALRQALGLNPALLDLNRESLWGPVAGILRDRGQFDAAIEAYQNASQVTPGSSYPHGNLAALYLRKGRDELSWRDRALKMFKKTLDLAWAELSLDPNDYYHIMDVAMSGMILGQEDMRRFDEAFETLASALEMRPTPEMLSVSQRGWTNLVDYCPDDWTTLKDNLLQALGQVEQAIEKTEKNRQRQ